MLPTSARLLRLLSLLQARRFWTGAALTERLEVTDRTLRRDMDRLRSLGFPVHSTSGVAGGYQLGAGATLPPLHLDDDEALAVAIALGAAQSSGVRGIDEAAVRAIAKLEQVLPTRLRERFDALRATIVALAPRGGGVSPDALTTIASACREHRELCFSYQDSRGQASERRVEPLGLVHGGRHWYFVAWDTTRSAHRSFRVDRISSELRAGARFTPRPPPDDGDLRQFVARSISAAVYQIQVSVILHAPLERIAERVPPAAVQLDRVTATRCRMQTSERSFEVIAGWILMLGVDFEVEAPEGLREHIHTLHARLGRVLSLSPAAAAAPSKRSRGARAAASVSSVSTRPGQTRAGRSAEGSAQKRRRSSGK